MLFSVGVESPSHEGEAFGLVVPALCTGDYACFSAADSEEQVEAAAIEAISMVMEQMASDGAALDAIKDLGRLCYQQQDAYSHCDSWLLLNVNLVKRVPTLASRISEKALHTIADQSMKTVESDDDKQFTFVEL